MHLYVLVSCQTLKKKGLTREIIYIRAQKKYHTDIQLVLTISLTLTNGVSYIIDLTIVNKKAALPQ